MHSEARFSSFSSAKIGVGGVALQVLPQRNGTFISDKIVYKMAQIFS